MLQRKARVHPQHIAENSEMKSTNLHILMLNPAVWMGTRRRDLLLRIPRHKQGKAGTTLGRRSQPASPRQGDPSLRARSQHFVRRPSPQCGLVRTRRTPSTELLGVSPCCPYFVPSASSDAGSARSDCRFRSPYLDATEQTMSGSERLRFHSTTEFDPLRTVATPESRQSAKEAGRRRMELHQCLTPPTWHPETRMPRAISYF
jgi:hypothetical protein